MYPPSYSPHVKPIPVAWANTRGPRSRPSHRLAEHTNMPAHPRIGNFHGQKRQLLGNQAGKAAPAWKTNLEKQKAADPGSKILLSRLPIDVDEAEVEVSDCNMALFFINLIPWSGFVQENRWAAEGGVSHLQFTGKVKGHGCGFLSTFGRRSSRSC